MDDHRSPIQVLVDAIGQFDQEIERPPSPADPRGSAHRVLAAMRWLFAAAYLVAGSDKARQYATKWDAAVRFDQLEALCTSERRADFDQRADLSELDGLSRKPVLAGLDRCFKVALPVFDAAADLVGRIDETRGKADADAAKAAARRVPGMMMTVTEEDRFGLVHEETVFGPEPGHEDTLGLEPTPADLQDALGITSTQVEAEVQALMAEQLRRVLKRARLLDMADSEKVRLKVVETALDRAVRDNQIAEVLPSLESLDQVEAGQLAQVRASMLSVLAQVLSQGAVYSRARRGDQEARGYMASVIVTLSQLTSAPLYYLPTRALATAPAVMNWDVPLPMPDLLVFHDRPLPIPQTPLRVLGWVFSGRDGDQLTRQVATAVTVSKTPSLSFETHLVSLVGGAAAGLAAQVLNQVTGSEWTTARRQIPEKPGSPRWKQKLGRSSARELHDGGLLRVRHLSSTRPHTQPPKMMRPL